MDSNVITKRTQETNKKEILFLLTQDIESPSGLGRYFPLSKNLAKQGFIVTIAAPHSNYESINEKTFVKEGVNINYVSQMHVKKEGNHIDYYSPMKLIWHSLVSTWRLFFSVINSSADIIIIGKPHPMNSIAGLFGGRLKNKKILLDCDDYEAVSNYFGSAWQKWMIKVFENNVPKLVDRVVTNTIFNQKRMENLGVSPGKIKYLPNGVDHERFDNVNINERKLLIEKMNLGSHKIITFIGSLSLANHPVDLLIKAFEIIKRKYSPAKLVIVGGGKDIDNLKTFVKKLNLQNDVVFVGKVPPDMVPYYYSIADISVDPVYDSDEAKGRCPLKMFESWVMETPFITADVGDRKYLLESDYLRMLSEPGNFEDLAEKILLVLMDETLSLEIIKTSKEKVKKFYWSNLVASNLHFYLDF